MFDESGFVNELKRCDQDSAKQNELWEEFKPSMTTFARKAEWAYRHYLKKTHQTNFEQNFKDDFLNSWYQFYLNTIYRVEQFEPPNENLQKTVFIGWHFPEYPRLAEMVDQMNILVLIASEHSWLLENMKEENVLLFRKEGVSSKLIRALANHRPIYAMLDYCYSTSQSLDVDFLGYPAKTPFGLIKLAIKYGYQFRFVNMRDKELVIKKFEGPDQSDVHDVLEFYNKEIEAAIMEAPSRWLLWPSVDNRWRDVNYDL